MEVGDRVDWCGMAQGIVVEVHEYTIRVKWDLGAGTSYIDPAFLRVVACARETYEKEALWK